MAKHLFRNHEGSSFLPLIRACTKNKDLHTGIRVHADVLKLGSLRTCSDALVTMYAKCWVLVKAEELLDMHMSGDIFTWTALVAGYAHSGEGQYALNCLDRMQHEGLSPNAWTFVHILKACGSIRAAGKGERIHDDIVRQGLLVNNIVLGTALVDMYAKCGALAKAQDVCEKLEFRNVVSWSALIAGYVQHGQGEQALSCFERMQREGISPNAVTFLSILKACGSIGAVDKGEQIHYDVARQGLLEKNIVLGTALVDMYARCGALVKAQQVCEELHLRDVVCWSALIAGYVQHGQGEQALNCFEWMQHEGLSPNVVTFVSVLKACGSVGAVDKGEHIHEEIARQGLLGSNVMLGTALVDMYAKCGYLTKAQQVLEELPLQDVVSWSALIAEYAEQGQGEEALNCFEQMQRKGLSPNVVTFVCILKACGSIKAADKGEQIHDEIVRQGLLGKDIVLGTALVDMYARCGVLEKAQQVCEELQLRDVVCWSALIAGYVQHGQGEQALNCFERMQHEGLSPNAVTFMPILKACGSVGAVDKGEQIHDEIARQGLLGKDIVLDTALANMYARCGALGKAQQVCEELHLRDVVCWSALISGYVQHGQGEHALNCLEQMQHEGLSPNAVTFLSILKACGSIGAVDKGEQIHEEIARQGLLESNIMLGTALVDMYAKCGYLTKAQQVLEELPLQDVVSWSALIAGYAEQGQGEQALNCFEQMQLKGLSPDAVTFVCILKACGSIKAVDKGEQIHDEISRQGLLVNNLVLGTALVDMYARCGALAKAQQVCEELHLRNVVCWSALIAGYVQHGQGEQALSCFELMQHEGVSPNGVTYLSVLKACGSIGAADKGEQVHDEIARQGLLESNIVLGTALVDMYAKCGSLSKAQQVLGELPIQDAVSWSALIAGYVEQGQGEEALDCFEQMQRKGFSPNSVTFLCILKACGSIRAVDKGEQIHEEIARQGLLGKDIMLGTALVDMYAKCGSLSKAQQVLEELPIQDVVSWSALIAGYAEQGQGEEALNCFEQMQLNGFSPNSVTFLCILKACGSIRAADKGEQIHDEIARQGLLGKDIMLGTALVDMYAKCGYLVKAQEVLEELTTRDVVSWSALIAEYTEQGHGEQAFNCFERMQHEGVSPDIGTFSCILKACGIIGAAARGEQIHDEIARHGLEGNDIVLGNALVDMYVKCSALGKAEQVLEDLPIRDVVSWSSLIAGYAQQGQVERALNCFERMQREGISPNSVTFLCILKACGSIGAVVNGGQIHYEIAKQGLLGKDIVLGTALVDMYAKCGALGKAQQVLEELPVRDVFSWSALITGYAKQGQAEQALSCFDWMQREGVSPNVVTFSCILKACGIIGAADRGEQIHDEIVRQGLLGDDIVLGSALVDMYAKCGALGKAQQVLEELPVRDVYTWSALIAGYAKQGQAEQALDCFEQMQHEQISPNALTFSGILKACGSVGATDRGAKIHDEIARQGLLENDIVLGTALVDMYAKCGALVKAQQVLEEIPVQAVGPWSALIAGYAKQGQAEQALNCFDRMQHEGVSPDVMIFSCILKACGSIGLVDDAQMYFVNMSTKYGIKPDLEHLTCMVDILGRAGHLDTAVEMIQVMPFFDKSNALWSSLLSACRKCGDVDGGKWAFEHAVQVDKSDVAGSGTAAGMMRDAEMIWNHENGKESMEEGCTKQYISAML